MFKLGEGEKDAQWYFLAEPVVGFVKTGISIGDEVTIKYSQSGGKNTVTYITKGKGEPEKTTPQEVKSTTSTPKDTGTGYKCEDCGAPLKDNKYKKCYTCNKKNPVSGYKGESGTTKDNLIKREAIGHMASRSLVALQGHVDPNNIHDIIKKLYTTYLNLIDNK